MTLKLMHSLLDVSGFIYEEITDKFDDNKDLGREFWKYMRSKFTDDLTKKIKVSDFIREKILEIDAEAFDAKYGTTLVNIKKSRTQFEFITSVVTQMLKYSSNNDIIDW